MIDDKIAGWLHAVELSPGSDRQKAIAASAKAYAASAKAADLPDLVLLAYGVAAKDAFTSLTAAVAKEDPTFGCTIGDLETRLIAAIFSAAVMEGNSTAAMTAASLIMNAEAIQLTSPIEDLSARAMEARQRHACTARRRGHITSTLDIAKVHADVPPFDQDGTPAFQQEVRLLRAASVAGVEATAKSLEALASRLSGRLQAADEELDLLWWCFAGRSETLAMDWTKVSSPGLAAIASAMEMHKLLQFATEPSSSTALLARTLGKHADKEITLATAVNIAGKHRLTTEFSDGHQLLPILSSLREYEALGGKAVWTGSVARWSIDPDRSWNALNLAAECLRELIVLDNLS
jgi:hypothetical protein